MWEPILLVHVLHSTERKNLLHEAVRAASFVDGPLAVFGNPAWLSAAIKRELESINAAVRAKTSKDPLILCIEKSGLFVQHFEDIDSTTDSYASLFVYCIGDKATAKIDLEVAKMIVF